MDNDKDRLLGQLAITEPGSGYVYTSKDLKREWYEHLTAEQRISPNSTAKTPTNGSNSARAMKC